jgi:hypothetical protein
VKRGVGAMSSFLISIDRDFTHRDFSPPAQEEDIGRFVTRAIKKDRREIFCGGRMNLKMIEEMSS